MLVSYLFSVQLGVQSVSQVALETIELVTIISGGVCPAVMSVSNERDSESEVFQGGDSFKHPVGSP